MLNNYFVKLQMEQEGSFEERLWLTWLLKIEDESSQKINLFDLREQWPNEVMEILKVFATWNSAEIRLQKFRQAREAAKEERVQFCINIMYAHKHNHGIDELLGALARICTYLKDFEHVPTNNQIRMCAKKLGTPWEREFRTQLGGKENWMRYLKMYLKTDGVQRKIALRKIRMEIEEKRMIEQMKQATERCDEIYYANSIDNIVSELYRAQQFLGLTEDEIPSKAQVDYCHQEIGTPTYRTLNRRLGSRKNWDTFMKRYAEQAKIEEFMRRY